MEVTRIADLKSMLEQRNYPSALTNENMEAFQKNYVKEVKKGWMIPISIEGLKKTKRRKADAHRGTSTMVN